MGKPVIVTAYPGNMDFTNNKNSYLVNFDLRETRADIGPYKKGYEWAEPNSEDSASLMFEMYKDQRESKKIGLEASWYIKERNSHAVLSTKLVDRFNLIKMKGV